MKKDFLKIDGSSVLNKQQLRSISGGWEGGVDPRACADAPDGTQCGPHHSCVCAMCFDEYSEMPELPPHCNTYPY